MRRILKDSLVVFGVSAGIALTAVSCSESNTSPKLVAPDAPPVSADRKVADLRAATDWMGDFHTGALQYVQAQLAAEKPTARTQLDRCKVASKAFKDFTKAYRRNGAPLTLPTDFENGLGCENGSPVGTRTNLVIADPADLTVRHDMSPQAQSYLSRIQSAVDGYTSDEEFIGTVYAIEAEAAAVLPYAEATAVFGTGAIAISSAQYWEQNQDAWSGDSGPMVYSLSLGASGSPDVVYGLSRFGRFILQADIAGAIGSFLKDWFTGVASVEKAAIIGAASSLIAGITLLF